MARLSPRDLDRLSARNLAKYGMRRGAYDGANRRRFVLFESAGNGNETRHEFDTKWERDNFAFQRLIEASNMTPRVFQRLTEGSKGMKTPREGAPREGATVNFSFSGSVTGARIVSVTETATGTKIDVRDTPVDVLAGNLNSGTWTISLGDFLYDNSSDADIEIFEFEPNLQFCV